MANRFKMLNGVRIEMTSAEDAARTIEETEDTRPRTDAEKDATAAKQAEKRLTDPAVRVLARAAGLTDAQFEIDLTAEIRAGL